MSIEICTSHFKEDLEWLKKSPWPVSIVHHEGGTPVDYTYLIPNVGYEITSYFKYIIERYDSLPDHVAFIHGHRTSYHQLGDRPLLDMIKTANIEKYDYIPLNNCWRCIWTEDIPYNFGIENGFPNLPESFITCCGGQFIVSKKAILKNTREQYEHWYSITTDNIAGVYFEMNWHRIFGLGDSIVPYVDHFIPKLKEILYSTGGIIPMTMSRFLPCFIGNNCPPGMIHITNKSTYDYYIDKGATTFTNTLSPDIGFEIDKTKLRPIYMLPGIISSIRMFENIAQQLSSDEHQLHE